MEEIISEKNERAEGSSSCSNSEIMLDESQGYNGRWLTLGVIVAESTLTHVCQFDCAF